MKEKEDIRFPVNDLSGRSFKIY